MTETSREELDTVRVSLDEKIRLLAQKIDFIPDPFSKLSMLQVQKGGTGAARIRRIPLTYTHIDVATEITLVGNFDAMPHPNLDDAIGDILYYEGVVIPTDYIAFASSMSLNYMYSNSGTTGNVDWNLLVKSVADTSTAEVILLNTGSVSVAVPAVADTMSIRSVPFTTLPKTNTVLFPLIRRLGVADSNNDTTSVWSAWIEYLSFI